MDIALTLATISSGPLGDYIPLQSLTEPLTKPARKIIYEFKNEIKSYMASSFGLKREDREDGHTLNHKRILA